VKLADFARTCLEGSLGSKARRRLSSLRAMDRPSQCSAAARGNLQGNPIRAERSALGGDAEDMNRLTPQFPVAGSAMASRAALDQIKALFARRRRNNLRVG
jgi:hypothetical protein